MRKIMILLLATFLAAASAAYFAAVGQFTVINTSTTTPVRFTNITFQVREATILGKKGPRTSNVGDVYIGPTSGDDSQSFVVGPDAEVVLRAGEGGLDLREWYLDVTTANDGLVIIYR